MQAITEAELESWHDYEVESPREIVALLRQISEKKQLIRLLVKGEADVCVTSLLAVDADSGSVVLDRSVSQEQNARIVAATKVMCETSLDKIRILFSLQNLRETRFEGGIALAADLPATLIRLQRREFYRMPTPVSTPVIATIPLPAARVVLSGGQLHIQLDAASEEAGQRMQAQRARLEGALDAAGTPLSTLAIQAARPTSGPASATASPEDGQADG
jgi:c-di-GMP-binding flagellar brake protein YcgR